MTATTHTVSEYFRFGEGHIQPSKWRSRLKVLRLLDAVMDAAIARGVAKARLAARGVTPQRVLLVAVEVPGREEDLRRVMDRIGGQTRHDVTIVSTPMAPMGKFDNINRALGTVDVHSFDWIMVVDDDIAVPDDFMNLMIYYAEAHKLRLAQPAHRFRSYASFEVTERRWPSLARQTAFVEIGPVSLLHRDTFADLLPFPSLRWCWGLDMYWADIAKRRGWRVGVVDAAPISHLRPIAASYDGEAAKREAEAFLVEKDVRISRAELFGLGQRIA